MKALGLMGVAVVVAAIGNRNRAELERKLADELAPRR